ncbi:MAG: hypothetical protein OXJ56_10475 [Rhodospirillaceae bacterium]|nr:hypothetical protein [Rhodospirillaceae bacterium]
MEADETAKRHQVGAGQLTTESTDTDSQKSVTQESGTKHEGLEFLENLCDEFRVEGGITNIEPSDVARLRLLGNCVITSSNDERNLGPHDINLVYTSHLSGAKLSGKETICLAQLGFQYLEHENVPLWSWYSMLSDAPYDAALYSALYGANDDEKIGAIKILHALNHDISGEDGTPTQEDANEQWFSEQSTSKVRSAALRYLRHKGTIIDYAVAKKEFDRNDISTSRAALECMVDIALRHEQPNVARQVVLESQFDSLNADLLDTVLNSFEDLDTTVLQLGLKHNNKALRRRAVSILRSRGFVDQQLAQQLAEDTDTVIRREAISAMKSHGKSFSDEEIEIILTKPKHTRSFSGLLGSASQTNRDPKGEELFALHELERLKQLSESELTKRIQSASMYNDAPYFARAERYFDTYSDELRSDVDDRFFAYFNACIERFLATAFGKGLEGQGYVERARNIEDFHRKRLTRRGLNILCRAGDSQDLQRIRLSLQAQYAEASMLDAEYIGKHGDRSDIALLSQVEPPVDSGFLLAHRNSAKFYDEIAKAILKLGKGDSISKLLSVKLSKEVLQRTVESCPDSRFSKISENALLDLFDHESSGVRRAASIKAVRSLSKTRISAMLQKYVNSEKYRYYNVIHWLDLGSSMPRDEVRKVTNFALG